MASAVKAVVAANPCKSETMGNYSQSCHNKAMKEKPLL